MCLIVVPWPLSVVVVVFLALATQPPLPGVCVPLRSAGYATHTESLWRCTISTPRLVARSDLRAWGKIEKGRGIFTIHPRGREQLKKPPKNRDTEEGTNRRDTASSVCHTLLSVRVLLFFFTVRLQRRGGGRRRRRRRCCCWCWCRLLKTCLLCMWWWDGIWHTSVCVSSETRCVY